MTKNSLSSLLGNYMSDSENDENNDAQEDKINSFSKEFDNLLDEIGEKSQIEASLPITHWTQCMDPSSGHPYYWNISTKEVTWEKPKDYEKYLIEIAKYSKKLPDSCWTLGYSEGTNTPYYVNEYTRVVSWEKPPNFKKQQTKEEKSKKLKNMSQASKKLRKSKKIKKQVTIPKHLEASSDEDVKIELISSYCAPSESSSGDEQEKKDTQSCSSELPKKLNIVAAYATDDESESEIVDRLLTIKPVISQKITPQSITVELKDEKSSSPSPMSPLLVDSPKPYEPTSFASIITGGKPENSFDEEINKLKEELEKDLAKQDDQQNAEIIEIPITKNILNLESNFDEKTFQRKRRIEFKTNKINPNTVDSNDQQELAKPGFLIDENSNKNESDSQKGKNLYSNFQRSHVEFGNNDNDSNEIKKTNEILDKNETESEEIEIIKNNCKELWEIIADKVKFLGVGHKEVSAVQAMSIQLETLLSAFRSSALNIDYFFKWLKQTSDDLISLEKNVAPDGWTCKWDRQSSQYCYENVRTNDIQWEFPKIDETDDNNEEEDNIVDNDEDSSDEIGGKIDGDVKSDEKKIEDVEKNNDKIIETKELMVDANGQIAERNRGEDEMDISTTPPPNEHEQIILGQYPSVWDADHAPPPPIISNSSPPSTPTYQPDPQFITNELASFYSDIANLDTTSNIDIVETTNTEILDTNTTGIVNKKRSNDEQTAIIKVKRKKVKVQGLGMKVNEVTNMVAKWQKAQKELVD